MAKVSTAKGIAYILVAIPGFVVENLLRLRAICRGEEGLRQRPSTEKPPHGDTEHLA